MIVYNIKGGKQIKTSHSPQILKENPNALIATDLLKHLNTKFGTHIRVKFTTAHRGKAYLLRQFFTVPQFALFEHEAFIRYYVIHEYVHCLGHSGHTPTFREKEQQLLKLYDINIEYARAYPKRLYANGVKVYEKPSSQRIRYSSRPITSLKKINRAVSKAGFDERLVKGSGYFYWINGDSAKFTSQAIYVFYLNQMSIEQWVQNLRDKKQEIS